MTTNREMERIVQSWLQPGLTTLTDDVLDPVLDQLPATPQRRPLWSPRRSRHVGSFAKFALAAAAVLVVAVVGINLASRSGLPDVAAPTLMPSVLPSQSAVPATSAPEFAPDSGPIDPGRYRWTWPGGEVSLAMPRGWIGNAEGMGKHAGTQAEIGFGPWLPGTAEDVNYVYADACDSADQLAPIGPTLDDLVTALEDQAGTDAVTSMFSAGPAVGWRVEIREAAGLDRSSCRFGLEGPLQVWPGWFALAPGYWGVVYAFDVNGERVVFVAGLGPTATDADVAEVDAIVGSFEFATP